MLTVPEKSSSPLPSYPWWLYGRHTDPCKGSMVSYPLRDGYWPCPVCWRIVKVRNTRFPRHGYEIVLE